MRLHVDDPVDLVLGVPRYDDRLAESLDLVVLDASAISHSGYTI